MTPAPEPDTRPLLEALQRGHRRLRATVTALIIVLAAVPVLVKLRPVGTVSAEGFVIQDAEGHARIHIGTVGDNSFITIYGPDARGQSQIQLIVNRNGPVATLVGAEGTTKIILGADRAEPYVTLEQAGRTISLSEAAARSR